MYQAIKPAHKKPILVKIDGKYNLKQIAVDRVEAEDGQYDVLFIGTGKEMRKYSETFKLTFKFNNFNSIPKAPINKSVHPSTHFTLLIQNETD